MDTEGTEFAVIFEAETEKALLLDFGDKKRWIPKSSKVLLDGSDAFEEKGDEGTVILADWFVEKEGIE